MEWITEEVPGVTIDGKVMSTFLHKKQELVRCKDCKHKEESVSPSWEAWCNRLHCGCDLDWFCADGVAKDINVPDKEGRCENDFRTY